MKKCPYCAEEIQDDAIKCKHCGSVLVKMSTFSYQAKDGNGNHKEGIIEAINEKVAVTNLRSQGLYVISIQEQSKEEKEIFRGHPAWINYIVWILLGIVLLFARGLGLVVLLFVWLARISRTYTITTKRVIARQGIIAKNTQEIQIKDIRSIFIKQGIFDRIFKVGTIAIGTAATGGMEVLLVGIKNPKELKEKIQQYK